MSEGPGFELEVTQATTITAPNGEFFPALLWRTNMGRTYASAVGEKTYSKEDTALGIAGVHARTVNDAALDAAIAIGAAVWKD